MQYRPEIDGLRAIAVGAVILYHAQITILGHQPFKGGFIGVDIFFVISGYLITSIILKELVTTGLFSFKHFYERRVRRILPALLFVMLVSLPFAWMYLLPSSFIDFSKSILYSLGFSSNFYFHYSGQEYGAESGLLKPFLHTWSLSVEEQFYILFPIILLITFKYFRKYLIHILILGFAISLGLADWGSRNHPSLNFYVLPTRGWELLAGSILAYFEIILSHRSKNKTLNLILPSVGLFLIGHSILFFNDKMFHPSFYSLSPVIGICLIIWFSDKNEIITKLLSTKLFVGIGLISYSLYLWHYPIFAFVRVTNLNSYNAYFQYFLPLVIFTLSLVTYFFIEKPFRSKLFNLKKLIIFIICVLLFLSSLATFIIINNGFKERFPDYFNNLFEPPSLKEDNIFNKNIVHFYEKDKPNIILVGDSHAETLHTSLLGALNPKKYNYFSSVFNGCQFIIGANRVNKTTLKDSFECNQKTQKERLDFLNKYPESYVIIYGRLPLLLTEERFYDEEYYIREGEMTDFIQNYSKNLKSKKERVKFINKQFDKTINLLLRNRNKIVLVYPTPEFAVNVPKILYQHLKFNFNENIFENQKFLSTSYDLYKKRTQSSFDLLNSFENQSIIRIFPDKLFCNTLLIGRCLAHDENNIFYKDSNHLSKKASELLVNEIILSIKNR